MPAIAPDQSRQLGAELFGVVGSAGDAAQALALIARGADLTLANQEGITTLMCAAAEGMTDVVQEMLQSGRDVALNAQDSHGWTALTTATHRGKRDIVKLLLDAGADARIADQMKRTALDYARGDGGIHALLLRRAAKDELVRKVTVTENPVPVMRPLTFKGPSS